MSPALTAARAHLRPWVVSAALLAAAGASGWILYGLDIDTPATAVRKLPDAPEAYMQNFVTVEMDGAGRPKRRIEASYMAYNADATIDLTRPHYVLYRAEGEPWNVRSERGKVSADGNVVQLLGQVDVWRNDGSGARHLDIRTEHLTVLPDSEYGETAQPVTIRTQAGTTTGTGLRAYLDETRFELLSRVRTHVYERRPRQ